MSEVRGRRRSGGGRAGRQSSRVNPVANTPASVSYTHLTLPTICSV